MRPIPLAALLSVALVAGCASRAPVGVARLKQRIDEMGQALEQKDKQIEDLNNRIFLLEDRVDTSRVAMEHSGEPLRLPVVRLTPQPAHGATEDPAPAVAAWPSGEVADDEGSGDRRDGLASSSAMVHDAPVAYGGDARGGGPRPVLRLHGSAARSSAARGASSAGSPGAAPAPDPPLVNERLPVKPLPRRSLVRKLARPGRSRSKRTHADTTPMKDYKAARAMYVAGQMSRAAAAFRTFVKRHTSHSYADNALYWLGECLYDSKNYRLALKMFRRVVEEYPTGNKAPDALLKMGFSYVKLEERSNARTVLAQLVQSYPRSRVARLASDALVRIQ